MARASSPTGPVVAVAKRSAHKETVGGRKWAQRRISPAGIAEAEVIGISKRPTDDGNDRPLLLELVRDGEVVGREPLAAARDRHRKALAELPPESHQLQRGEPAIPTEYEGP